MVLLRVKVTPKARSNAIVGWEGDRLIPDSAEKVTFGVRQSPGIEIVGEVDCIPSILPPLRQLNRESFHVSRNVTFSTESGIKSALLQILKRVRRMKN